MQPKTEELLYLLLWATDVWFRPTFRNLTDSFEAWAYRNGLGRQLARLERLEFLESDSKKPSDRLYRLTEKGRLHALGGRDPEVQWARPWDGRWRLVLFDVPMKQDAHRVRMRRYLRTRGFGCLQGSVWITPDPVQGEAEVLAGGRVNVNSLLLLEARPCSGESDAEIVAGAWDFAAINGRYIEHVKLLEQCPVAPLQDEVSARKLLHWAKQERAAWFAAVELDPLLPQCLLSADYMGRQAWQQRIQALQKSGEQIRSYCFQMT